MKYAIVRTSVSTGRKNYVSGSEVGKKVIGGCVRQVFTRAMWTSNAAEANFYSIENAQAMVKELKLTNAKIVKMSEV